MARMSNREVVKAFFFGNKEAQSHNGNLYISWDGNRLMNYGTCIVQRTDDGYIYNATRYSNTTSHIQSYVRYEMHGLKYTEVKNVKIGTCYLA